jgi:hypothetical protein
MASLARNGGRPEPSQVAFVIGRGLLALPSPTVAFSLFTLRLATRSGHLDAHGAFHRSRARTGVLGLVWSIG